MRQLGEVAGRPVPQRRPRTRRSVVASGLGLGLAALMPRAGGAQAGTPAPSEATFPVTVRHALGETTIPAPPSRIVTTNESEALDSLLALRLTPVLSGFSGGYGIGLAPWTAAAGGDDVEFFDVIRGAELDAELIAAATPDLILGTWLDEAAYDQLSGIAPTVVVKASDTTTWQEVQRLVGETTGTLAAAEAAIAATEAELATQRERLAPYADRVIAIAYEWFDELFVHGETAPIGRLLHDLGMDVLTLGTVAPGEIDTLSLERLDLIAGADIIISPAFIPDELASQEANPLFQVLPAVRNGGYVTLSPAIAQAIYNESTLSMPWGVPRLVDAIIEAAAGRGKRLDDDSG